MPEVELSRLSNVLSVTAVLPYAIRSHKISADKTTVNVGGTVRISGKVEFTKPTPDPPPNGYYRLDIRLYVNKSLVKKTSLYPTKGDTYKTYAFDVKFTKEGKYSIQAEAILYEVYYVT